MKCKFDTLSKRIKNSNLRAGTRNLDASPRKSRMLSSNFSAALLLCLLSLLIAGCGAGKELETAKQQIETLNSEVKKSAGDVDRLSREKSALINDSKLLSDKNEQIRLELEDLKKAKNAVSAENKELKKKNSAADAEIVALKQENSRLSEEVEKLNKRTAESAPPPKLVPPMSTEAGLSNPKEPEALSPCDAVLAYMKACEAVVRQQKGEDRTKSLENLKQLYAPKMKGAPKKAIKAAEGWVEAGVKFWDTSSSDSTFQLLQLRNTVLDECGKSVNDSAFK